MKKSLVYLSLIITASVLLACQQEEKKVFTSMSVNQTGISFSNRIKESDSLNIFTYEYVYNGGGVALGDFNNDKLTDVYFTGNTTPNKLYLNKGDMKFEDVTQQAGVDGAGRWSSGVAMVDINNDGLLDMYVCATARKSASDRTNLLYVNQGVGQNGIPTFKEMAADYGIADTTHTTNAAFFDYDNDGDLDLYILVNEMDDTRFPNQFHEKVTDGSSKRNDRLYRNDFDKVKNHPVFTDVTTQAKIFDEGFGLGINITDINQDGWKDIYITNDFLTNDLLYINNHDGTFTDQAGKYFKHTSYSAMGNDVADINNDGLVDLIALDMMPATNDRKKMMTPANSYITYQNNDKYNYTYQYARNTLQVNQGKNPVTGEPIFSEIGLLAGIAQTDWSWAPMVTDFDNDGLRDIIITNGFPRDINDHDFLAYREQVMSLMSKTMLLDYVPVIKLKNYAYQNKGNFVFEDVTDKWGITELTSANGAAYADLDNDGDLDYIVNNINDSASVYRNNAVQIKPQESNYLRVQLEGTASNRMGLGAWIEIKYDNGKTQVYEHTPYRGYLSSVELTAHFGLGKTQKVDELKITWQGGKTQILKNIKANQVIKLTEADATLVPATPNADAPTLFTDITGQLNVPYKHEEIDFIDFNVQKLLPHKLSQFGPAIAVGDVNGDGLEDMFIGGSNQHKGRFLIQSKDGKFSLQDLLSDEDGVTKITEDMGVLLFDAENDGDLDLYIVSGSYEFEPGTPSLQDKFYINDGKGHFQLSPQAIPQFLKSGSCVKAADYDHDGDLDLFIGGRVEPNKYPLPVSSYILRNDSSNGQVKFSDVTAQVAPRLQSIGLVCDALWSDYDNDGWQDLVLVGEWMPVTILKNNKGKFEALAQNGALNTKIGWWTSISSGDFDNDGDIDYIAGNLGTNTLMQANNAQPVSVYAKDFNNDGFFDAIPTVYFPDKNGIRKEFPYNTRDDLAKQFIQTRQRFQNYAKFSEATINEILKPEEISDALVMKANWMKSSYLENKGNGIFDIKELPVQAQFAPVYGMVVEDFDQDGNLDVLLTGNDYGTELAVGRQDALNGLLLKGGGNGNFSVVLPQNSGYCVMGDAKSLVRLTGARGDVVLVASQNKSNLKFFSYKNPVKSVALLPNETSVILKLKSGKTRKEEVGYGSSFLSQSSRSVVLAPDVTSIEIVDNTGKKRKINL
jgi:hypothetical protein